LRARTVTSPSPPRRASRLPRACFGVVWELLLEQVQLERKRNEPLLCAVVQVALQPFALGLTGVDDPRARALQVLEPSSQLRM